MTNFTKGSETGFQGELRILMDQMARLGDVLVNIMFDLKARGAINRLIWLIFLLFISGFLISLKHHPLSEWSEVLQECFLYLLNPEFTFNYYKGNPFSSLLLLGISAIFNPYTLQYLPIFLIPFFIAYQAASLYLYDIFELRNFRIAQKFIQQVALTGSMDTIRFTEGNVLQKDFESPIYQIGGPGKVIVDLDSIVLFEKADGQPHVIGPTDKERGGTAELEGFERVRHVLDLRDHHLLLSDGDPKAQPVKSHSLDGIPVAATDVRMMYSIYRGENQEPTPELPYPFTIESVEQLVYNSTSKVLLDQEFTSGYEFKGMDGIVGLVRGELSRFMSERKLIEYLASISRPEVDKASKQEDGVLQQALQVLSPYESTEKVRVPPPPPFTSRHEITDLFSQFASKFTDDARKKGMVLHWVGIGTWKLPSQIVPEQHLEAWELSHKNMNLGSESALKELQQETELQKIVSLIQNIPLAAYQEAIVKHPEHKAAIKVLLLEYQSLLIDNFETLHQRKKRIPPTLVAAIEFINVKTVHYVSPSPPRTSDTPREEELYQQLLQKIGLYRAIEQLIRLERENDADASREELLEKINRDWDLDINGKWAL